MKQKKPIQEDSLAILHWYKDAGVTDIVGENTIDYRTANFQNILSFLKPEKKEPIKITAKPSILIKPKTKVESLGTAEACLEARNLASNANSLEELKAALKGFKGSGLEKMATNMVFADGNPKARIMLIGEAPRSDEDRAGKPFVGIDGQLLDKMLNSINLNRDTVYISNIINWRPPGNRSPSASEIAICLPFIQRHIELIEPEFILYIGGVSAKALLETSQGITRLRGKWIDYKSTNLNDPIPSMAIFHPAYLLRSPAQKKLAWLDLLEVKNKMQLR